MTEVTTERRPSKRKIAGVTALSAVGVLFAGAWAWDATHHDDHGVHGAPVSVAQVEDELAGAGFTDAYGTILMIRRASCRPGENGNDTAPATHFLCELKFDYGSDTVVVHVLPDELLFKPSA